MSVLPDDPNTVLPAIVVPSQAPSARAVERAHDVLPAHARSWAPRHPL